MNRKQLALHNCRMLDKANEALVKLMQEPDSAVDISATPVGALRILKECCDVGLLFSGDNVFGIIQVPKEEDDIDDV